MDINDVLPHYCGTCLDYTDIKKISKNRITGKCRKCGTKKTPLDKCESWVSMFTKDVDGEQ